jgi:1,4-dihydroxy-6-naphthoate synthase
MQLSLAYSPCPNDTFLFYHLVHSNLSSNFQVKEELHDVEHLNQKAVQAFYDVTKLSFFAFFHVLENYILLNTGSALGRGCGPILVKKQGKKLSSINNKKILVPGLWTTANLLLNLYLQSNFEPIPVRYDLIINKLLNEEYELGVIIHEERFTYEKRGLEKVQDLGEFWEEKTSLPIPLGAIAIKRNLPEEIKAEFELTLRKSLDMAYANPKIPHDYIIKHSQEKDLQVVQNHIDLYVNQYTREIGEDGKQAVIRLLQEAQEVGLVRRTDSNSIERHIFFSLKK